MIHHPHDSALGILNHSENGDPARAQVHNKSTAGTMLLSCGAPRPAGPPATGALAAHVVPHSPAIAVVIEQDSVPVPLRARGR